MHPRVHTLLSSRPGPARSAHRLRPRFPLRLRPGPTTGSGSGEGHSMVPVPSPSIFSSWRSSPSASTGVIVTSKLMPEPGW
ncbi:hypothetical protein GCM10009823_02130 [Brevibacterium salitolerans]|uniref:Uncharacterized protein n=1 Tax=Brevibacterium salitolerans TaxID=1403566 RepID=A0ABN2WA44_9MICO